MRPRHDIEFNDRARLKLIKALAVGRLAVRQVTGKVNQDDGSDPVYKSQVTITRRAQAPVFRHGVSEPSVVLKEYIQRQSKR